MIWCEYVFLADRLTLCFRSSGSQLYIYGFFFFQAEDGIRDLVRSRGLGDVYKRQFLRDLKLKQQEVFMPLSHRPGEAQVDFGHAEVVLSLIHI